MRRRAAALLLLLVLPAFVRAGDPDKDALARKAHAVLKANCHRCHGQEGANEGGFDYVLDVRRPVERRKLAPGNAATSRLLRRLAGPDDPMPPADEKARPSQADLAALRAWVEAGAPPFAAPPKARDPITPADLHRILRADLAVVGPRDRRFTRYLTLTHLRNAGLPEDELQSYRHALAKLVNALS